MQIKVGTLRRLIREAALNKVEIKARNMAMTIFTAADGYIDSVIAGQPDKHKAAELQQAVPEAVSFAKWMLQHREHKAEPFAQLAKTASDIADKSGFWQRPAFLNKHVYVDEMQTLLRRLQRSYQEVNKAS